MNTLLEEGRAYLEKHHVPNSKKEAQDLLAHTLLLKPLDLVLFQDRFISDEEKKRYRSFLERRGSREPFAYIVGEVEFFGCFFELSKEVLVPRQETEILLSLIEKDLKSQNLKGKVLADLGTGSGCLAISLKKRFPDLSVMAVDLSEKALEQAKAIIYGIVAEAEVGKVYKGRVTSIVPFGVFVEILPGKEGLCHISEFDLMRIQNLNDCVKVGDQISVKVLEINDGKVKLSRKATLTR